MGFGVEIDTKTLKVKPTDTDVDFIVSELGGYYNWKALLEKMFYVFPVRWQEYLYWKHTRSNEGYYPSLRSDAEIARKMGISYSRVRQIRASINLRVSRFRYEFEKIIR